MLRWKEIDCLFTNSLLINPPNIGARKTNRIGIPTTDVDAVVLAINPIPVPNIRKKNILTSKIEQLKPYSPLLHLKSQSY